MSQPDAYSEPRPSQNVFVARVTGQLCFLELVASRLLMASAAAFPLKTAFSTPAPRQKSPQAASSALSAVKHGLPKGLAGSALPHLCTCKA
jgi:hypothetical protein